MKNKLIIYIDASNIIYAFKNLSIEINIKKLIIYLQDKYRPNKIIYFTPRFKKDIEFYNELNKINNIEIIYKKIFLENEKLKANCDVEISHKLTQDLDFNNVDNVILLSGDRDFMCLVEYVLKLKKQIKIIAGSIKSCSVAYKRMNEVKVSFLSDIIHLIS